MGAFFTLDRKNVLVAILLIYPLLLSFIKFLRVNRIAGLR